MEIGRSVAEAFTANVDRVIAAVQVASTTAGEPPDAALIDAARDAADELARPVTLTETVASIRLPMRDQMTAGLAAFFLLFTVQLGVIGLLEERQQGTLPRLRSAPIGIGAVLGGKAAGSLVVGLASMIVLAAAVAAARAPTGARGPGWP
jgi:ABC-2 type transport system permease protein